MHTSTHSHKHRRSTQRKKKDEKEYRRDGNTFFTFIPFARSLNVFVSILCFFSLLYAFLPISLLVLLHDLFGCQRHDTHVISLGVFSSAFWTCNLLCMFLSLIRRQFNPFAERDDFYDKVKKSQECCCSQFIHLFSLALSLLLYFSVC